MSAPGWVSQVIGFLDLQNLTGLNASQSVTSPGVPQVNPGKVLAIPTEIAGMWANLRDGKLWRSLGWLLLGIILILMGAWLMVGRPVQRALGPL